MSTELDLDALEREGRPDPLVIKVRGQSFTTTDPLMMSWKAYDAVNWYDTHEILKAILAPEDLDRFEALDISQHALNALGERVSKHYFGTDPGESGASPAS